MADRQRSLFLVEPRKAASSRAETGLHTGPESEAGTDSTGDGASESGEVAIETGNVANGEKAPALLFAIDERSVPDGLAQSGEQGTPASEPDDQPARRAALNPRQSILVQAPAGAGKTSLLTQRYLALLAEVEEPEQILAITFTRAATAEMRGRILMALEAARRQPLSSAGEPEELALARRALRHADDLGWRILEQPHRLGVETIDSFCLRLAHGQPLLARLGGALEPTEDAQALYAMAARRTTALLGRSGAPELDRALSHLLLRRDNNLPELEQLLAVMLGRRDAWLGVLPVTGRAGSDSTVWLEARQRLEQPFVAESERVLRGLRESFEAMPALSRDLLTAARYAAGNLAEASSPSADLRLLRMLDQLPGHQPEDRPVWEALATLLLTGTGTWRKEFRVDIGFPPPGNDPGKEERKQFKTLIETCSKQLQAAPSSGESLRKLLCDLRALPPSAYSEEQWQTLLAIFEVLRRAAGELRLVFAETNTVDFVEIAQAALWVLRDETSMRGLLESEHKQHLLVDEFQDTSRAQYALIAELLREWQHGDGRTVFLVGDPLQSIYAFRQAEVALFHQTRAHGLPCGNGRRLPCEPLQLTHNFRSHQVLVEQLNRYFTRIFPGDDRQAGADRFLPAHADPAPGIGRPQSLVLHSFFTEKSGFESLANSAGKPLDEPSGTATLLARRREAEAVVRVLLDELPRIESAERAGEPEYRVALLVRSRSHLRSILPALREAAIPFRAVDLDPLAEQPEIQDLTLLLRALLHPADRVAWLAVLRAPWCGLSLADLHQLTGGDDPDLLRRPIPERMEAVLNAPGESLSADGVLRLRRVARILASALRTRDAEVQATLAPWLERTWMALGGPACVSETARSNAESFFRLLDTLSPSGIEVLRGDFDKHLARLCAAPDTRVSERFGIQIMTIHKAKGLGFQVVLLPGLERTEKRDGTELVAMLERAGDPVDAGSGKEGSPRDSELLLAPCSQRDAAETDSLYPWVNKQREVREAAERKRLFYVACTRARTTLHLFATVSISKGKLRKPARSSLLDAAWPALAPELEERWQVQQQNGKSGPRLTLAAAAEIGEAAESEHGSEAANPLRVHSGGSPDAFVPGASKPDSQSESQIDAQPDSPVIERLPVNWQPQAWARDVAVPRQERAVAGAAAEYARSQGSLAARARGTAMHTLLERLALLFAEGQHGVASADPQAWETGAAGQLLLLPGAVAGQAETAESRLREENAFAGSATPAAWRAILQRTAERALRAAAFSPARVRAAAAELTRGALAVASDPIGRWLLTPKPGALAESTWQLLDGDFSLRTLRVDRSFYGGSAPGEAGTTHLWIVDYKTGARPAELADPARRAAWLAAQRGLYEPQLAAYGAVLAAAAGSEAKPVHYGLYFPELLHLLSWAAPADGH